MPHSIVSVLPDEATQSAAQDAGSTPSAVPAEVSPEVNAEMREGATLLLEHLEKVYKPDVDRLDPWKDLCSACGLGPVVVTALLLGRDWCVELSI